MKRTALSTALLACLAGLLVTFSTTGCKKDNSDNDPSDLGCLLRSITTAHESWTYTYDGQGRVVRRQSEGWYATFTYGSGLIDIKYFQDNGGTLGSAICRLNASGNVESFEWPAEEVILQMTYDAEGYLKHVLDINLRDQDTSVTNFYVQNGDYVLRESEGSNEQLTYFTEYDNPSENKGGVIHLFSTPFFYSDGDFQVLPMGKPSKHLLKASARAVELFPDQDYFFWLEYETNEEGYVTKALKNDGFQEEVVEYEYDCK